MPNTVLRVEDAAKAYTLGEYGGGSFLQEMRRKLRGGQETEPFYALRHIDLTVEAGQAVGIIGGNGAGKSTLLKLISRITSPTEGIIRIRGRVASLLEIGTGFHPELTGRENIYLNGAIMGLSRAEIRRRLPDILEFSELERYIDTPVKRYSSGMSVKLGFAVAANLDPDILICDEVLAVGDMAFQQKCLGKMRETAVGGRTVLYVSHNMRTIAELCDRVVCLDHGSKIFDGSPEAGIERYTGSTLRSEGRCELSAREREAGLGEAARLEWVECRMPGNDFEEDAAAELRLGIWTSDQVSEVQVQAIWYTADYPVGSSGSGAVSVAPGRDVLKLRVPLEALATGEYALRLCLSAAGGEPLDDVMQALRVTIREDKNLNLGVVWTHRYWGNVRIKGAGITKAGALE